MCRNQLDQDALVRQPAALEKQAWLAIAFADLQTANVRCKVLSSPVWFVWRSGLTIGPWRTISMKVFAIFRTVELSYTSDSEASMLLKSTATNAIVLRLVVSCRHKLCASSSSGVNDPWQTNDDQVSIGLHITVLNAIEYPIGYSLYKLTHSSTCRPVWIRLYVTRL